MSTPRSLDLPPEVRRLPIASPRGVFAVLVAGPALPARGCCLLIPGLTGSKEDFATLLPQLAANGWLVAAYDQRGQYETPGAGVDAYTLESLAADAAAVVAAVSPPGLGRHLLGHSFGGLVAQTAVLAEPTAWCSLALLCSGPGGFGAVDATQRLRRLLDLIDSAPLEVVHEEVCADDRRRGRLPPPSEIAAFLRTRFLANAPDGLQAMARLLCEAPDRVDDVARLGLPCAVLRGADDDAWEHQVQDEMAVRLGTATTVIGYAAHSPAVENPIATARALCAFLDAVEVRSTLTGDEGPHRVGDQLHGDCREQQAADTGH